jgi:Raf kinase inhibitor-like YbhB/YbcL family protein
MKLTSPKFQDHAPIPSPYTSEGEDIAPPLEWADVPPEAKSLALIVEDPDAPDPRAPKRIWVHWVVYNLPPNSKGLPEGARTGDGLPPQAREGTNDWGAVGYRGPAPPVGRHRYFFKLYALDKILPDMGAPRREQLLAAMEGAVLATAELVGTYEKSQ